MTGDLMGWRIDNYLAYPPRSAKTRCCWRNGFSWLCNSLAFLSDRVIFLWTGLGETYYTGERRSNLFDMRPNELNEVPSSGGAPQSPHSPPRVLCIFLLDDYLARSDEIRAILELSEACVR